MKALIFILTILMLTSSVSAATETEEVGNSVLFWLMSFTGLVIAGFSQWLKMPLLMIIGGMILCLSGLFGITLFENDIRSFTTIFPVIIGIVLLFLGGNKWGS